MDHRTPLKLNTQIAFEGMSYFVEDVIGQGSNAIVYKGWYPDKLNPDQRHHVLIKELFPFHPERKIWRDVNHCIVVDPDAQAHWNTHKESFLAGNEVHLRLLADHPDMVGGNLNSFCANGTLYSILGYTGGRSLQAEVNTSGHDLRHYARLILRLLDALEAFHKSGCLHLDISPDNIMLVGSGENERIFLIDFNSTYAIGTKEPAYLSRKPGYTAPEVETGDLGAIGFPADLYAVAAVFYRFLMGRTLTLEETLRIKAPDGKDSSCLKDMPETVVNLVDRILKKGLHTLPAKRYQSIGQMRRAFAELIDRIDCVGVTHWSLWENGKRSVEELIRINPSLRYVKEASNLYPIRLKTETSVTLSRYLEDTLSPAGSSSLIVAKGGMGKTTLLLHTAMLHSKRYSPNAPAVFYISLNSWNGKDTHYIENQILMNLRFKRDMNNYESANHALRQLLNQPLKTKAGEAPAALLLLDGLNEVHGDTAALAQQIHALSKLSGVRIIATSRNEMPALQMRTAELIPLEIEDIESALGRNGLLIPQKQEALQLLRTPLILSIYIQASEAGKQLDIETEQDLMKAYMDALLQKELKQLPEGAPEKWQIDVALNYVLPAIAAKVKKKGHALTERQLLKIVEECRKTLRSLLLKRAFPQWIGHSKDIFCEAKTAEQWYGIVIHNILYQRLGLLIRDDAGRYRVFHQSVGDYLAKNYKDKAKRIRRRSMIKFIPLLLVLLVVLDEWRVSVEWEVHTAIDDYNNSIYQNYISTENFCREVYFAWEAANAYVNDSTLDNYKTAIYRCNSAAERLEQWPVAETEYSDFQRFILDVYGMDTSMASECFIWRELYGFQNSLPDFYMVMLSRLEEMLFLHSIGTLSKESLSEHIELLYVFNLKVYERANAAVSYYSLEQTDAYNDAFAQAQKQEYDALADYYGLTELPYTMNIQTDKDQILQCIEDVTLYVKAFRHYFYDTYDPLNASLDGTYYDKIYGKHGFFEYVELPRVPNGLPLPEWNCPDSVASYVFLNPEDEETVFLPPGDTADSIPLAWYATYYSITYDEVMSYVTGFEDAGYTASWEGVMTLKVVVKTSEWTMTITWSPTVTNIIVTGFDHNFF